MKLDTWRGPLSFDLDDLEHCKVLGKKKKMNLNQCKDACRMEIGCNAINHDIKKSSCETGSCAFSLESTPWIPGTRRGYFLAGGIYSNLMFLVQIYHQIQ